MMAFFAALLGLSVARVSMACVQPFSVPSAPLLSCLLLLSPNVSITVLSPAAISASLLGPTFPYRVVFVWPGVCLPDSAAAVPDSVIIVQGPSQCPAPPRRVLLVADTEARRARLPSECQSLPNAAIAAAEISVVIERSPGLTWRDVTVENDPGPTELPSPSPRDPNKSPLVIGVGLGFLFGGLLLIVLFFWCNRNREDRMASFMNDQSISAPLMKFT
jgi:hypothetical protein